ncbi:MAG: hypothetical protein MJK18_13255 [Bdellovibrionales bacterium]|nr:hypothetical protein [Bdellovibrionales bacterium]
MAVLFVGLFILTQHFVFIWILIGSVVLLHPENEKYKEEVKGHQSMKMARRDAKRYGVRIPEDESIKQMTKEVYQRYRKSLKLYPHLKNQYESIIDDFWKGVVMQPQKEQWRYLLSTLLAEWALEKQKSQQSMRQKLEKVRELTQQWDDAKKEAYGDA